MVVCGQKSYGLDQKQASWDAVETLNIINPDRGCLTCVGFAPSQGRRCRNPIAQHNRTFAFKILNKISNEAPDGSALVADLRKIAATSLCLRYHQGQVDSVVAEWQSKIQSVKAQKASGTRKPYFGNSPYDSKPSTHKPSFSDFHSIEERLNDLMKKLAEYEVREQERKAEEERKRLRMEQKQKEKEMEEHKEKARQEKERKEQEKARKEAEEEQRKREEERNQEEEKQRKREEEERKQEEERKKHEEKAREQEEFNERARQRTQKAREEKERKEEQEGLEWKQAWNDYIDSWILFRKFKDTPIPWPVKSGLRADVRASAVKAFYDNAPETDKPTAMYKLMQRESLKWHTDKINLLLRGQEPNEADKMIVDLICRIVIEVRQDAQDRRSRL